MICVSRRGASIILVAQERALTIALIEKVEKIFQYQRFYHFPRCNLGSVLLNIKFRISFSLRVKICITDRFKTIQKAALNDSLDI